MHFQVYVNVYKSGMIWENGCRQDEAGLLDELTNDYEINNSVQVKEKKDRDKEGERINEIKHSKAELI